MNEVDAWEYLASGWSKLENFNTEYYNFHLCAFGLCHAIHMMVWQDLINKEVYLSMIEKVYSHPLYTNGRYLWPIDEKGASERASFCIKQVKLCTENSIVK